jgi:hypothetical protein
MLYLLINNVVNSVDNMKKLLAFFCIVVLSACGGVDRFEFDFEEVSDD